MSLHFRYFQIFTLVPGNNAISSVTCSIEIIRNVPFVGEKSSRFILFFFFKYNASGSCHIISQIMSDLLWNSNIKNVVLTLMLPQTGKWSTPSYSCDSESWISQLTYMFMYGLTAKSVWQYLYSWVKTHLMLTHMFKFSVWKWKMYNRDLHLTAKNAVHVCLGDILHLFKYEIVDPRWLAHLSIEPEPVWNFNWIKWNQFTRSFNLHILISPISQSCSHWIQTTSEMLSNAITFSHYHAKQTWEEGKGIVHIDL